MRLENKVALVTSCRSSLCGQTAQQLAAAGASVMICGRNTTKGRETVAHIRSSGGRAGFVLADVSLPMDVKAVVDETIATYGRLDILLNYISGESVQDSELIDVSEVMWDRVVESGLKGTFFCCQYALPFLQQSSGTIINMVRQSSDFRFEAVTTICQGGVAAMTSAIAQQYPVRSVTANMIWIKPLNASKFNVEPLASKIVEQMASPTADSLPTEETFALSDGRLAAPTASGIASGSAATRPSLPPISPPFSDVATAVLYLATRSSTIQGATLVVSERSEPSTVPS